MMAQHGFQADPAKLARHAADFPTFADRAHAIHGELASALADAGDCWGGDEAGRSFADGHVPAAGDTLSQLSSLPGRLHDVGDRFATTAAAYQQADEHGATLLDGRA
jgi:uncharacterized protein YukE